MMSVVQPAYHALPNGGHGSFSEVGNRVFSCVLVFATTVLVSRTGLVHSIMTSVRVRLRDWYIHSAGYVIATRTIS